ncbi:hypothetical protein C8T65DRAFT_693825 [Cerioporus squamosus]|nr:hypothetical protein C8T65DRAFT_693825 [Cerioporus squamosus]
MSYPLRPCGGSFSPSSNSIVIPANSTTTPAEEDFDAMIEQYAREFDLLEQQGDLSGIPKGATWERTAEELSKSHPVYGEVNMQYDPEAKNRTVRITSEDRFRLLAFIEAQRKTIEQSDSQGGVGRSNAPKNCRMTLTPNGSFVHGPLQQATDNWISDKSITYPKAYMRAWRNPNRFAQDLNVCDCDNQNRNALERAYVEQCSLNPDWSAGSYEVRAELACGRVQEAREAAEAALWRQPIFSEPHTEETTRSWNEAKALFGIAADEEPGQEPAYVSCPRGRFGTLLPVHRKGTSD